MNIAIAIAGCMLISSLVKAQETKEVTIKVKKEEARNDKLADVWWLTGYQVHDKTKKLKCDKGECSCFIFWPIDSTP